MAVPVEDAPPPVFALPGDLPAEPAEAAMVGEDRGQAEGEMLERESEPSPATEDLRRTEVIHVGEDDDDEQHKARRGWWTRFLT
ncbi:hypothetical protein [Defluviicoccus vanus]|uniref:Uncharacterized protein n=1 Tax=Defluviicoccus vanus TaxID=111831 RepID=A0A7H1N2H2_9PROT|nr:hypothetical protein [Defluviicoccus vanus]QNT69908.1 hypothetical protein HQ394_11965 [Defluviicoccus vanus]